MKKIFTLILTALLAVSAYAQTNPNRVVLHKTDNTHQSVMLERVESITFPEIEGRVAADIEFQDYKVDETGDNLWVGITRTPACVAFKLVVIPANYLNHMTTEADQAYFVDSESETLYWQDFESGQLSGLGLDADADYCVMTLGFDELGTPCSISRVDFHTPKPAIVGNPSVECTVDEVTPQTITFSFVPNEDTSGYAFCIYKTGEAEQQLAQWGPMFGFSTIGDMVRSWGIAQANDYTYTYTGMKPNTDYELYIQPWDVNENNADYIVVPVTTGKLGGEGVAEVTITAGEFQSTEWGCYQVVTYTPNDQCSFFRDMIIEKAAYESEEWGDAGILEYLKGDNPFNPYWDQYTEDEVMWNADPATEYIAFAIGQNANGEWGPLARLEITTPAVEEQPAGKAPRLGKRVVRGSGNFQQTIPNLLPAAKPAKPVLVEK